MTPDPYSFTFEWFFVAVGAAAAAAYARTALRDRPGGWRIAAFTIGIVLLVASLNSPLETIAAHYLLLIHLLQNALVADLAPPLLILGLTPAMREAIKWRGGRPLAVLTRARVTLPLWLLAWYGTHAAPFYEWALRSGWGLTVEHAILVLAGLLFWWPLLSGRLSTPAGLAYLGAGFASSAFLGLAYIFSSRPFYDFYADAPRLWGFSPARDQNLGGVLMNAEQTAVFLLAIGWYVWRLLEEEHEAGTTNAADGSRAAG
jgi:putative membrane protein